MKHTKTKIVGRHWRSYGFFRALDANGQVVGGISDAVSQTQLQEWHQEMCKRLGATREWFGRYYRDEPTKHKHKPHGAVDRPFNGAVSNPGNPAAHGNITREETCRCGAKRFTNINQCHIERGKWTDPGQ